MTLLAIPAENLTVLRRVCAAGPAARPDPAAGPLRAISGRVLYEREPDRVSDYMQQTIYDILRNHPEEFRTFVADTWCMVQRDQEVGNRKRDS